MLAYHGVRFDSFMIRSSTITEPVPQHYSTPCSDQYSLGPSADTSRSTAAAVADATKDGSKWVLKPQREGGGNNLYGSELSEFLTKNKNDPVLSGTDVCLLCPLSLFLFLRPHTATLIHLCNRAVIVWLLTLSTHALLVGHCPHSVAPPKCSYNVNY